jgi:hypothetical protein
MFGLCEPCLQLAISKKWCVKCWKARSTHGMLCNSCHLALLKSNAGEYVSGRQAAAAKMVDVADLLRRVEHMVRPPVVGAMKPEPIKPLVLVRATVPLQQQPSVPPFAQDGWYWKWARNAYKSPKRILLSHCVLMDKPRPMLPRPSKPPVIPQEVWLERLYQHYCEPVMYDGVRYDIVQDFRLTMPLEPAHIERFVLDPRVIMLTHLRSQRERPSRHCVICASAEDARYMKIQIDCVDHHESLFR